MEQHPDKADASHRDWAVALDLGEDSRATESDALYIRCLLTEDGIETLFYPWEPAADVLTPLGAVRPLKLLVPVADLEQARALVDDVLEGRPERSDVAVPVADAWVLRYDLRIVARHLQDRARERGGLWLLSYQIFRLVVVLTLAVLVLLFLRSLVDLLVGH